MLVIRLSRTGKKSQPSFRVIVQEKTAAVKGKFIKELGYYKPAVNPKVFSVDMEKIKTWIKNGAKPSDSLASILKKEGLEGMDKYLEPRNKKKKSKKEGEKTEAPAATAPAAPAPAPAPAPAAPTPVPQEQPKQ